MILLNRRSLLMQAAGMIGAGSWSYSAAADHLGNAADIDAVLRTAVEAGTVPGLVAMVATERSVVYQGSFGFRDVKHETRMSPDTIFRIASMIKLLTSVAALQLVEQGKLKLDDPAAKIDPTLASLQVLAGFNPQGAPQLRLPATPITLRHLLSHTSGFSYQLWDSNVVRYLKLVKSNPSLPRTVLMFDPGTKWAYDLTQEALALLQATTERFDESLKSLSALELRGRLCVIGQRRRDRQPEAYE